MSSLLIRPAEERDLSAIATIGSEAFSGLRPLVSGEAWVRACWAARPRLTYWVAEDESGVLGYILWLEKGGFRKEAVLELEQIAVSARRRKGGVGAELIRRSLTGLRAALTSRGASLKLVEVTTGSEQGAVEFYHRVLGTEIAATLHDVFRGDEYVLIARRGQSPLF